MRNSVRTELSALFGTRKKSIRDLRMSQKVLDSILNAGGDRHAMSAQIQALVDDDALSATLTREYDKQTIGSVVGLYAANLAAEIDDGIRGL
jgi:hypothetical protein